MLVTFVHALIEAESPFSIWVPEERLDELVELMATTGWRVLNKVYWPPVPDFEILQVALLEVGKMESSAPIRLAVEFAVSFAVIGLQGRVLPRPDRSPG